MRDFTLVRRSFVKGLKLVVADFAKCDWAITQEYDVTMRLFMVLYDKLSHSHIVASSTRNRGKYCDLTILFKTTDKTEYAVEVKYKMLCASRKDFKKEHGGAFKWVISFDDSDPYCPRKLTFDKIKKAVSRGRRAVIHVCPCTDETNSRYKDTLRRAGFLVRQKGKGKWQIVLFQKGTAIMERFNPSD